MESESAGERSNSLYFKISVEERDGEGDEMGRAGNELMWVEDFMVSPKLIDYIYMEIVSSRNLREPCR